MNITYPKNQQPDQAQQSQEPLDFSSVLACAVHDMKNSLCMLIHSIDTLSDIEAKEQNPQKSAELAKIHYEASRLNTNLLQMLSLYRVEKNQLPIVIEEHYLEDTIEDVMAKNQFYSDNKNITIKTNIEPDLVWFFDDNLIGNLLNDVFVNALRYTKDTITIDARTIDVDNDQIEGKSGGKSEGKSGDENEGHKSNQHLQVTITDNGTGYPAHMLENIDMPMQNLDLNNDRTGLGLFFARLIANAHQNQGRSGNINLTNDTVNGGSVFTLMLP